MYCEKCFAAMPDDAKFCKNCGSKMNPQSRKTVNTAPDNKNKKSMKQIAIISASASVAVIGIIIGVCIFIGSKANTSLKDNKFSELKYNTESTTSKVTTVSTAGTAAAATEKTIKSTSISPKTTTVETTVTTTRKITDYDFTINGEYFKCDYDGVYIVFNRINDDNSTTMVNKIDVSLGMTLVEYNVYGNEVAVVFRDSFEVIECFLYQNGAFRYAEEKDNVEFRPERQKFTFDGMTFIAEIYRDYNDNYKDYFSIYFEDGTPTNIYHVEQQLMGGTASASGHNHDANNFFDISGDKLIVHHKYETADTIMPQDNTESFTFDKASKTFVSADQNYSPDDYKKAYKEKLGSLNNLSSYTLFDMNKDGIPELIAKTGTCEGDYKLSFYTYKKNSGVNMIGNDFSGFHIDFACDNYTDCFCTINALMGSGGVSWYYYDGTKVTERSINNIEYGASIYDELTSYGDFSNLKYCWEPNDFSLIDNY